ncbi:MAG: serine/threonine-protein phosphatase, partial [Gammaproteobacteria bacterium]|nr:serine/threonine-protein phosphatase [Gammaproteobacteria bacterium]
AVGVLVGDATGHGLTAAFMTMLAQSSLDSIRGDLPTDATLSRLNALLCERLTGRAMTAVFFRISRCGALSVSHAGHPSLVVLPASGAAPVSFRNGGCALGLFDDEPVPYVEEQYRLAPGDTVFACTDGLLEWRDSAGAPFGEKRLLETLARHARQAPDALLDATLSDLRRYGHGGRGDDVTLLACRFCATG